MHQTTILLHKPWPMPQDSCEASFHELLAELPRDNAPFISYGISYPAAEVPYLAQARMFRIGIQAVEYLTANQDYTFCNLMIGFFCTTEDWALEQRFATRDIGTLSQRNQQLHDDLHMMYSPRLLTWLDGEVRQAVLSKATGAGQGNAGL